MKLIEGGAEVQLSDRLNVKVYMTSTPSIEINNMLVKLTDEEAVGLVGVIMSDLDTKKEMIKNLGGEL